LFKVKNSCEFAEKCCILEKMQKYLEHNICFILLHVISCAGISFWRESYEFYVYNFVTIHEFYEALIVILTNLLNAISSRYNRKKSGIAFVGRINSRLLIYAVQDFSSCLRRPDICRRLCISSLHSFPSKRKLECIWNVQIW